MQILGHFSSGFAQLFIDVDQAIISTSIPSIAQLIQRLIWESWATKSGSSPSIISRPRWFRFAILFHAADPSHAEDYWGSSPPDRIPFCFSLSDLLQWRRVYVGIVQTRTERELIPSSAQIGCIWFIWLHWFIFQGFPASSQGSNNHHSTSPVEANWGPALLDSPRRFPALPPPVPSGPQRGSILPGGLRRSPAVPGASRALPAVPGGARFFPAIPGGSRRLPTIPTASSARNFGTRSNGAMRWRLDGFWHVLAALIATKPPDILLFCTIIFRVGFVVVSSGRNSSSLGHRLEIISWLSLWVGWWGFWAFFPRSISWAWTHGTNDQSIAIQPNKSNRQSFHLKQSMASQSWNNYINSSRRMLAWKFKQFPFDLAHSAITFRYYSIAFRSLAWGQPPSLNVMGEMWKSVQFIESEELNHTSMSWWCEMAVSYCLGAVKTVSAVG